VGFGKSPTNAFQSGPLNPMYGRTGALNPMYGKVTTNAFQSGPNHPMFGQPPVVAVNANNVYVYSLDNVLIHKFSSQVSAAS
jgi:hypothetical protein